MNRDPIGHFLRMAGNTDYALTWTDPASQGYALAALLAIAALKPGFRIAVYYLPLAAPVAYIAGGHGIATALRALKATPMVTATACAALAIVPSWNASAAADPGTPILTLERTLRIE
jgi:hypothetical protein